MFTMNLLSIGLPEQEDLVINTANTHQAHCFRFL